MCTEFWVGWFDHWGNGGHMRGDLEQSAKDLDKMLELGHVNIYMFEGGAPQMPGKGAVPQVQYFIGINGQQYGIIIVKIYLEVTFFNEQFY